MRLGGGAVAPEVTAFVLGVQAECMTGILPVQGARRDARYTNCRNPCLTIQLMFHLFGQTPR